MRPSILNSSSSVYLYGIRNGLAYSLEVEGRVKSIIDELARQGSGMEARYQL